MKLPNKLQFFKKDWRVSVSSLIHWNKLCYSSDLDFAFQIQFSLIEYKYWVQNPLKNHDDVVEYVTEKLRSWISIRKSENGYFSLTSNVDCSVVLGKDLAYLFGFTNMVKNTATKLQLTNGVTVTASYSMQIFPLFPTHIFLYSNVVKPSLLGGDQHNLLKIIPLSEPNLAYKIVEFTHEEFLSISTSEVEYINFELRTHSGSFVEFFDMGEPTYLNLCFKQLGDNKQ